MDERLDMLAHDPLRVRAQRRAEDDEGSTCGHWPFRVPGELRILLSCKRTHAASAHLSLRFVATRIWIRLGERRVGTSPVQFDLEVLPIDGSGGVENRVSRSKRVIAKRRERGSCGKKEGRERDWRMGRGA